MHPLRAAVDQVSPFWSGFWSALGSPMLMRSVAIGNLVLGASYAADGKPGWALYHLVVTAGCLYVARLAERRKP